MQLVLNYLLTESKSLSLGGFSGGQSSSGSNLLLCVDNEPVDEGDATDEGQGRQAEEPHRVEEKDV